MVMGAQYTKRSHRRGTPQALLLTILVSVVVHMAFLPILVSVLMRPAPEPDYHLVEFEGLPRDLTSEREEPEPEYDPEVDLPERQVVEAPEVPEEAEHEGDAEWLSDEKVRVEKQSKAQSRLKGAFEVGAATAGPEGLTGQEEAPGVISSPEEPGEDFEPAEEGTVLMGESPLEYQPDPDKPAMSLKPTFDNMASAVKGSGIDALEGVEEGPQTLLDTDEWQFAGFFNRVKSAVAQHWHPGSAYSVNDPTGRVYGYKDRETVVKVVLSCDGELEHTYVKHPSGAGFLDDVAVKAIKKASPFLNPPHALCDVEDGIIAFNFGFLVKVGDSSFIKVKKF
jgi:hypothetical protein